MSFLYFLLAKIITRISAMRLMKNHRSNISSITPPHQKVIGSKCKPKNNDDRTYLCKNALLKPEGLHKPQSLHNEIANNPSKQRIDQSLKHSNCHHCLITSQLLNGRFNNLRSRMLKGVHSNSNTTNDYKR